MPKKETSSVGRRSLSGAAAAALSARAMGPAAAPHTNKIGSVERRLPMLMTEQQLKLTPTQIARIPDTGNRIFGRK